MLKRIIQNIGGDPNQKAIDEYALLVQDVNALEAEFETLSEEQLRAKTGEFRSRLESGETLDDLMVEVFAAVREASKRTISLRHYDVQLIGGAILHQGQVAEMRTGEGKTLVATLPMYLNALTGEGVHLITVNDYLARRDARWMAPIFNYLGLSVGVLQMGSRTENGRKAFLINLEKESPQEDQHQLELVDRVEAYRADITYGTNNEFGFDYLRDNMRQSLDERVQRGHSFAIIDEVDNVLIDEARTPLIISGPAHDDAENYVQMAQVVKRLRPEDYEIDEKGRTATLTEIGETRVEQIMGIALRDPDRPEDITPEQARLLGFLEQAMRGQFLFHRNKDYLVQGGQVIIIDEFTGRLMPGRRWSDGLHQSVEAKEGVKVQSENITHATITIQNYFRMYQKLSGMTGTALTEAEEFSKIYDLEVLALPPNIEYIATRPDTDLEIYAAKDEYGYEYTYYAYDHDPQQTPAFWKRKDYPDMVYRTKEAKLRAIVQEIITYNCIGRPILVGTTSVESSERLSNRLRADSVRKLMQATILRQTWLLQNDRIEDGRLILPLAFLYEPLDKIDAAQMRSLAKEMNISLNPEDDNNTPLLLEALLLEPGHEERLRKVLKRGIPHEVLNARKHTEESQIITGAGAFGAVTIATNMAGRGVDIKLGGEVAEEVLSAVNRVLRRAGIEAPYDMSHEARRAEIQKLDKGDLGIYESEIDYFLKSVDEMAKVKELGGLHVIGSERHEARRIDNQLRGRAARQGDPGSSRFYLSMEDDLMRLFGGQQMDAMMQRLGMDEALPLELNLVGRIIEGAQTRVEGANFDARKHLLEYDDVLNSQRVTIYAQRDRIFTKQDLDEDVDDMLITEIQNRIPAALEDKEGPWKLLGWLDQIQPPINLQDEIFPSFTYKLLLDSITSQPYQKPEQALTSLVETAQKAMAVEEEHILHSARESLKSIRQSHKDQLKERLETLDTFFEGLRYADETDTRATRDLLNELSNLVRVPLNLPNNELRLLREDPDQIEDLIGDQIETFLVSQAATRLIGSVERRLLESLNLASADLAEEDWDGIDDKIIGAIQTIYENRRKRFFGENLDGQLAAQVRAFLEKVKGEISPNDLVKALIGMTQEERTGFDKRTHRQIKIRTSRFVYAYYAAHLIEGLSTDTLTEDVLTHLQEAQEAMTQLWGLNVWDQVRAVNMAALPERAQKRLAALFDTEALAAHEGKPLEAFTGDQRPQIITQLGGAELNETFRQLILRVISELWIEYLTKMEALRISIGLEAYGQRDPLVMYKTRASAMFAQLFSDMRISVVTRMFTFRPRQLTTAQQTLSAPRAAQIQSDGGGDSNGQESGAPKKKRRRRRKKK